MIYLISGLEFLTAHFKMVAKECKECGLSSINHFLRWIEDLLIFIFPFRAFSFIPQVVLVSPENLLIKLLIFLRIIKREKNFLLNLLHLRTATFINEAKKRDIEFKVHRGPFGYLNFFEMRFSTLNSCQANLTGVRKKFLFEGLPRAEFLNSQKSQIIDDKYLVKKILQKEKFPVVDGKAFWWFQKRQALKYATTQLGFPLVVKPRTGSLSLHLTTNIQSIETLRLAIDRAISYSPVFIIEKFLANTFTYRATLVDFDFLAVCQQIPANVVGDGYQTIGRLIEIKNQHPQRGQPHQKGVILYKLVIDETTKKLLESKNYSFSSVPKKGEIVYLQEDSFLKLGGDLIEVSPQVHPDNRQLFQRVAKLFGVRLVGIDFLAQDISLSWKEQSSAILELNSLPSIEMHHFPSSGQPQNVAREILKMVFRYYQ